MSNFITADLAIIGTGSGNTLITPFWDDRTVVMAEKGVFGGTCINVGCIPTKMFVRPATLARTPEEASRLGVEVQVGKIDWPGMRDRIFGRIDAIAAGGRHYRAEELENVTLIEQAVTLDGTNGFVAPDGTRVEARQMVIAAGSRAALPDVEGIDLDGVHTSDTIMRLEALPERLVVVGGGYIACEFAGVFSGLGSAVTQVIRGPELLSQLDESIRGAFNEQAREHWNVVTEHPLERIERATDGTLIVHAGGERFEADAVLMATGRTPNTDLIGAREAKLDMHDDGRLIVDEYQRVVRGGTPVEGVYAIGDICSPHQLKHVANYEARIVMHNLENPTELQANEQLPVPAAIFSYPEIAMVGLTSQQATEQYGAEAVVTHTQRYGDTAYGWAMEDQSGLFTVIAERKSGLILGAHAMGYQASNLIQPVISAMSFGIPAHRFTRGQYWIHPALMEVTENAMLGVQPESTS
ncbi:mycothione reductase [Leucobacter sp. UCMA 4100]|uniref:mycothione reductase n=1 Tax=Leucobacter sp. UCMA 4100 TaxID=2810534 RepID=UPI0022EA2BB6|nr:mycothione reductase [Leucobacter sp. UCMA 4100]MDA3145964.1 mycothione reductase [Leucobacter sp. UCMA 4100]